jgi:hypothetical protein
MPNHHSLPTSSPSSSSRLPLPFPDSLLTHLDYLFTHYLILSLPPSSPSTPFLPPSPAVPFDNPQNYNHQAARHAESLPNAVWTNQFDNIANRQAHIDSTGPEIWDQTRSTGLDAFVCATGTGGTLAGVTRYLKEKSGGEVKCFLADPPGSVLYKFVEEGVKERTGTGSITEGERFLSLWSEDSGLLEVLLVG